MKTPVLSVHHFIDRESGRLVRENFAKEGMFKWFYTSNLGGVIGRIVFKSKRLHRFVEWYCNSRWSKPLIKKLIKAGNIDVEEAEWPLDQYQTLNEFFCRRLKAESRPLPKEKEVIIAPGEGKLIVHTIHEPYQKVVIKGVPISIGALLADEKLAERYRGGQIAILRLYLGDYHRFHFPVSGKALPDREIRGSYYPVSPLRSNKTNFYIKNHRVVSSLITEDFGLITMVMIGGFLISSIQISYIPGSVKKGEEQGCFAFGGSTLIWLSEKDTICYDEDILRHSRQGVETFVKLRTGIGIHMLSRISKF